MRGNITTACTFDEKLMPQMGGITLRSGCLVVMRSCTPEKKEASRRQTGSASLKLFWLTCGVTVLVAGLIWLAE
jgi:hypothetical protein